MYARYPWNHRSNPKWKEKAPYYAAHRTHLDWKQNYNLLDVVYSYYAGGRNEDWDVVVVSGVK